jgi:hypothetical protein
MNSESKNFTPNARLWAEWGKEQSAGDAPEVVPEIILGTHCAAAAQAVALDPRFTGGKTPPPIESEVTTKEQRRYPRFKCEGSLELKTEGSALHTWATFTDVSASGCYVEIMTTFPVGTVMDLRLGMHGFLVETRAVVRATYPFLGMGIEFTEVSPKDLEQLRLMLESLAGTFAKRLQMPEPKRLKLPPITEPGAFIDALAKFFEEKEQSLGVDEFVRLAKESQQRSM